MEFEEECRLLCSHGRGELCGWAQSGGGIVGRLGPHTGNPRGFSNRGPLAALGHPGLPSRKPRVSHGTARTNASVHNPEGTYHARVLTGATPKSQRRGSRIRYSPATACPGQVGRVFIPEDCCQSGRMTLGSWPSESDSGVNCRTAWFKKLQAAAKESEDGG
jgi:hypothetical protein